MCTCIYSYLLKNYSNRNVVELKQIKANVNFEFECLERSEILMLRLLHYPFVLQL